MDREALQSAFDQAFAPSGADAGAPRFVISPGRVNLIGEHTDYNAGFVCPMAIEPHVLFAFRGRVDDRVRVGSTYYPGEFVEFRLSQPIEPHLELEHWSNYIRGIAAELLHKGVPLTGVDVMLTNTLPTGSGLSSSAAVEVGMGKVLLAAAGQKLEAPDLAILAQQAEHNFPKVMCGIMDQMIVATGKRDHAMLLDCRSLERIYLPIDSQDLRVVIVNSMQRHANAGDADSVTMPDGSVEKGTPYNMRRIACEIGVLAIRKNEPHIKSLRDATLPMLDAASAKLTELIYRRCRHVITEIERCEQFAAFMGQSRYDEAGELMVASHNSLRDDYEVSAEPLDFLAAEAMKTKGVYGSRMTGAGFGGCTVSLVQPRAVDAFTKNIAAAYEIEYGKTPQVIVTTATDGARVL